MSFIDVTYGLSKIVRFHLKILQHAALFNLYQCLPALLMRRRLLLQQKERASCFHFILFPQQTESVLLVSDIHCIHWYKLKFSEIWRFIACYPLLIPAAPSSAHSHDPDARHCTSFPHSACIPPPRDMPPTTTRTLTQTDCRKERGNILSRISSSPLFQHFLSPFRQSTKCLLPLHEDVMWLQSVLHEGCPFSHSPSVIE